MFCDNLGIESGFGHVCCQCRSSGMYMAFNILDAYRWWWYFSRPSPPQTPGELGFMEAVYSCMFGDGDPNKTFEEKRWNVIGRYIQVSFFNVQYTGHGKK